MGKASRTRTASRSQLLETVWRQAPYLRMLRRDLVCAITDGWQHRMPEASSMKQPQKTLLGSIAKPPVRCCSNQAPRAAAPGSGSSRSCFWFLGLSPRSGGSPVTWWQSQQLR